MDGDAIIFSNFYKIVQAPPFQDVVWWNQPESGPTGGLNGGQVYFRNAKPDGPAVHTMVATLMLTSRWKDDGWEFAKSKGVRELCMYPVSWELSGNWERCSASEISQLSYCFKDELLADSSVQSEKLVCFGWHTTSAQL
jgi:hypothetical protein